MVNEPDTNHLIHWSDDGDSFIVTSADNFSKDVLPRFFKHSNFGSFVRQCNMYGFHKVPNLQQGVLHQDESAELLEFSNPNFVRGQPDLLCLIKRQKGGQSTVSTETSLDFPTLLTDLAAIRKHQTALSAELKDLQTTNHALWQEAIQSRERHSRQQETINKILRFLATVFGGHVVDSSSNPSGRVQESSAGARVQEFERAGSETGQSAYSGSTSRVVMPRTRSRLLLEDVKSRRSPGKQGGESSTHLTELSNDDGDDIEEIPLLRDDPGEMPPVARNSQSPAYLTRNTHRFSDATLGSTTSSTGQSSTVSLPSDVLSAFYSTGHDPFASLSRSPKPTDLTSAPFDFSNAPSGGSLGADSTRALIRSPPHPAVQAFPALQSMSSSTFDGIDLPDQLTQSGSSGQLSPSYERKLADSADKIKDVATEKADIDRRTAALENAISRLMQNLPEHTREALGDGEASVNPDRSPSSFPNGDLRVNAADDPSWTGLGSGQGSHEPIDIDRFLEQFVNSNSEVDPSQLGTTADYSNLFNLDDVATPSSSMRPPQIPPSRVQMEQSNVGGHFQPYEVISPSVSGGGTPSTTMSTPAATDVGDDDDYIEGSDKRRQTRKRKSDAEVDGNTKSKRTTSKRKK
ncbi:Heat shock transcription factor [Microbotryomycetes sp. JL201]|nr:Heat shock transcription factor [Microbotryomycetes sp. JL201]